jgi:MFS family permease
MYNATAGWLMTNLTNDPFVISLVQVANNLPMFMFAVVAGALSDIVDKRRFLLAGEIATTALSAIFAALVWFNEVTPASLLWFMFFIGAAGALTSPAWQAVVPELVPKDTLSAAVSANSAGINVSRAIGPALAGAIIGPFGVAVPFVVNAVSNFGVIGALAWWREPKKSSALPAERFGNAIRAGLRYARYNPSLQRTFARSVAFVLFASTYWALLPLVARSRISGGAEIYGFLLGAIGLGAVGGAFLMPSWNAKIGPDRLVAAASAGTAIALVLFGLAREPLLAVLASIVAGVSGIAAVGTLNVSAQASLPDWVRGRGLSMYITVFFGSLTIGSAIWGQLASLIGLPSTHFVAAAGALLAIPIGRRWKLQTTGTLDLTPSMQWPAPIATQDIAEDNGPVLVTIEYRVRNPKNHESFLTAMNRLRHERLRDGAYSWGIFEDSTEPGRFLETFLVDSWLEHLRQHERVTNADEVIEKSVQHLLETEPTVTHFISPIIR